MTSPRPASSSPRARSRTSPPAAFPPSAFARCAFFRSTNTFPFDFTRQDVLRVRVQPGASRSRNSTAADQFREAADQFPSSRFAPSFPRSSTSVRTRTAACRRRPCRPPRSRACRPRYGRHPRSRAARPTRSLFSPGNSMISRTLVPRDVRPLRKDEAKKPRSADHHLHGRPHRRTLGPLRRASARRQDLDPRNTCRSACLSTALLSPRGMPVTLFERPDHAPEPLPLDILDSRVVVPVRIRASRSRGSPRSPARARTHARTARGNRARHFHHRRRESLDRARGQARRSAPTSITRILSVLVHVGLIIFLIFTPKIFPPHVPTQQETDLARKQLTYLLPEEPPAPPHPPSPKLRITPKTLNRVAPPVEEPAPTPAPPR